jgi:hypothetical protein
MVTRTWRVSEELASRVKAAARREGVWDSDLVEFLLRNGLTRLESGQLKIPKRQTARPYRVAWPDNEPWPENG